MVHKKSSPRLSDPRSVAPGHEKLLVRPPGQPQDLAQSFVPATAS